MRGEIAYNHCMGRHRRNGIKRSRTSAKRTKDERHENYYRIYEKLLSGDVASIAFALSLTGKPPMDLIDIKQKIRKLKSLEIELRSGKNRYESRPLLWHEFFDLSGKRNVKYPLPYLLSIDADEYKRIAGEFSAFIYGDFFEHLSFQGGPHFDKALLVQLGLPYDADSFAVKKKFRQLAKQYHPDMGGHSQKFIELMDLFQKLTNGD